MPATYTRDEMISASQIQRKLPELREMLKSGTLEKIAHVRNNEIDLVTMTAEEYDEMMTFIEDLQDLITIYERKDEPTIPLEDVLKELNV